MSLNKEHSMQEKLKQANNAIYVSKKLLVLLRSSLSKNKSPIDKLPSDRDLLDNVTQQMIKVLKTPVYYKVIPGEADRYKYFDSDVVRWIMANELILDKGRFIDACLIAYIYGEEGLHRYCVASRVIYPQQMDQEKLRRIEKKAAEIAASIAVESVFVPTTLPFEDSASQDLRG